MQIFYAPDIDGTFYILDERESKHTIRVLRMREGDPVKLIDGKGNLYEGVIKDPDPKRCLVKVESVIRNFEKRNYRLHIAISPLKNPERFEWFVEKSVEIGIDEITPLICRNTEKPGIKTERINNIIISAIKQSLKPKITLLNSACSLGEFINQPHDGRLMIAHCNENHKRIGIAEACKKGEDAVILIGPEGDFSEEEIKSILSNNFTQIHLGPSRLRAETAGVAACHSIYFINQ
ncbi:MAG: 16S rRNA (uracil(1498)-N(3))-methyltransferase [Bacteroidales bacterium]|jgi:16S rRNA (uracil1498-N3)-methyltransferase|nr:16S rRNA (uracil(1498)-N(3))-methyltransferase [Bacteroidales bacterium]